MKDVANFHYTTHTLSNSFVVLIMMLSNSICVCVELEINGGRHIFPPSAIVGICLIPFV